VEQEQQHLRDAQLEMEECERKVQVMLEHKVLVSQQLDHTKVHSVSIAYLLHKYAHKAGCNCIPR